MFENRCLSLGGRIRNATALGITRKLDCGTVSQQAELQAFVNKSEGFSSLLLNIYHFEPTEQVSHVENILEHVTV